MIKKINMSELQLSALQEAGNIGSAHAAIALSQMIGHRIAVAVTSVMVANVEDVIAATGTGSDVVVSVCLRALGGVRGVILFILSLPSSRALAEVLTGKQPGTPHDLDAMEQSSLKEAGNIIASSYLNAISEFLAISAIPTVPQFMVEKTAVILQQVLPKDRLAATVSLGIETEFVESRSRIKGQFVFVPDTGSLKTILEKLGV